MTEQLARYHPNQLVSIDEIERAAKLMAASGFFQDATQVAQAGVKIMAGAEIGIGPFASMVGIHIIKGKPTYGANIIASKVKSSGKYDYIVDEISDKACRLTFFQGDREIGKSVFTIEDARKAGTQNTDKYARNMLFARAMSNGQKWYCPDVTSVTMYTPQDFGAEVDDNGNITNAEVIITSTAKQPAPAGPNLAALESHNAETPAPQTERPAQTEKFHHAAMWKKMNAAKLLTPENVKVWLISPNATDDEIAGKIALMHAALDPTYGSNMPDPRTGDGENQ
jgi:hypothetical protein